MRTLFILLFAISFSLAEVNFRTIILSPEVLSNMSTVSTDAGEDVLQSAISSNIASLKTLYAARQAEGTLPNSLRKVNWDTDVKTFTETKGSFKKVIAYIGSPEQPNENKAAPNLQELRSGKYKIGEFTFSSNQITQNEAKAKARQELVNSIRTRISSEQTSILSNTGKQGSRDFISTSTTKSDLQLQGLNYLETTEGGKKLVIAYVSNDDINKTVQEFNARAKQHFLSAQEWLNSNQGGQALQDLWDIYQLSYITPGVLLIDELVATVEAATLAKKISVDLQVKISTPQVHTDMPGAYILPLQVLYKNTPQNGGLRIADATALKWNQPIQDGAAQVVLTNAGTTTNKAVELLLAPNGVWINDSIASESQNFQTKKSMQADFSSLVKVQIRIEDKGSQLFRFVLEADNLVAKTVQWDFGDQTQDNGSSVLHTYSAEIQNPWIKVTINKTQCYARPLFSAKGDEIPCEAIGNPAMLIRNNKPVEVQKSPEITPIQSTNSQVEPTKNSPNKILVVPQGTGAATMLATSMNASDLLRDLEQLKTAGKLRYTKQKVNDPDRWYRVFITPEGRVAGFFTPGTDDTRKNPETNETYLQWKTLWKGKKVMSLWIEEL